MCFRARRQWQLLWWAVRSWRRWPIWLLKRSLLAVWRMPSMSSLQWVRITLLPTTDSLPLKTFNLYRLYTVKPKIIRSPGVWIISGLTSIYFYFISCEKNIAKFLIHLFITNLYGFISSAKHNKILWEMSKCLSIQLNWIETRAVSFFKKMLKCNFMLHKRNKVVLVCIDVCVNKRWSHFKIMCDSSNIQSWITLIC